jgi:hypothetical protein
VRLCLIPDSAPPYDADAAAGSGSGEASTDPHGPADPHGSTNAQDSTDGQSSPDRVGSPGRPGSPDGAGSTDKQGRPDRQSSPDGAGLPGSRIPAGPPGLPVSPATFPGWPGQFAQVLAETLAGSRSPRQLVPWTTERARERIQRLGPQLSAGQQPRVRRVMTFHPTADVMEMTVVVGFGKRVHALAVRLERTGSRPEADARPGRPGGPGRWLCVAVEAA